MENNNVLLIKNATILDVEEKREIEADILIKITNHHFKWWFAPPYKGMVLA